MALMISIEREADFLALYYELATHLLEAPVYDRGEVHAQKLVSPLQVTPELTHVTLSMPIPQLTSDQGPENAQAMTQPNLPWAEDQFWERVSGEPLNPPPSHEWWPYAVKNNDVHIKDEQFSHTYPERYWPKMANTGGKTAEGRQIFVPHVGIRFLYGDLDDLIVTLKKNPLTRQAYLPIWFPEDTYAASQGERVPCSLGYHFLVTERGLNVTYPIRSCDFMRHFKDDVYMTMRLAQYVGQRMTDEPNTAVAVGELIMHIGSLHIYEGDRAKLTQFTREFADKFYQTGGPDEHPPV